MLSDSISLFDSSPHTLDSVGTITLASCLVTSLDLPINVYYIQFHAFQYKDFFHD
jgi:hypothetical protein